MQHLPRHPTFSARFNLTSIPPPNVLQAFLADESAAAAIEYAMIDAGVSIVIFAAVSSIGIQLNI